MKQRYIPGRNAVVGHAGWWFGLAVVTSNGSLMGYRRVTVYGPNGDEFDVESTEGWAGLQHEAAQRIVERTSQSGEAYYLVVLTLCAFATVGAALRYTGWPRFVIVLAALALLAIGVRLDSRPRIRD